MPVFFTVTSFTSLYFKCGFIEQRSNRASHKGWQFMDGSRHLKYLLFYYKGFQRKHMDFKVSWKMGWRQVTQSRMMVWDARVYFIHGKRMLRRSEALSLKWEYQFIRILFIYIINPIGIINLASVIQWNLLLLMGNRYFTLNTFFRMSGGNRGRSTGRVNKPYVEISLLTSWVLCLRNRVILQNCSK